MRFFFLSFLSKLLFQGQYQAPIYNSVISKLLLARFPCFAYWFYTLCFAIDRDLTVSYLICIPLPFQVTAPEADHDQVGAKLHTNVGHRYEGKQTNKNRLSPRYAPLLPMCRRSCTPNINLALALVIVSKFSKVFWGFRS